MAKDGHKSTYLKGFKLMQRHLPIRAGWFAYFFIVFIAATALAGDTTPHEWTHARDGDLTGFGSWRTVMAGAEPMGDIISLDEQQEDGSIWQKLSFGGAAQQNSAARPWDVAPEESGGTPSISFNQSSEEYGSLSVQTDAGDSSLMNINHSFQSDSWIKNYSAGVQSDSFSTLLTVGATMSLAETEAGIIATRLQAGYAMLHGGVNDSFQGSADLFISRPIMDGQHWIKGGWFIDQQSRFGKTGPALSLLLNAENAHPLTVDMAYGFGYGVTMEDDGVTQVAAADGDLQTRVGTYLGGYQVGATAQYLRWDNGFSGESWEGGGFVGIPIRNGNVLLDFTMGESGPRGMANVVLFTGAQRNRATIRRVSGDAQLPVTQIRANGNRSSANIPSNFAYSATTRTTQIRTGQKRTSAAPAAAPDGFIRFFINSALFSGAEVRMHASGAVPTPHTRNGAVSNINALSGTFVIVSTIGAGTGNAVINPDGVNQVDGNGFTYQTALAGSTIDGNSITGARLYPVP